MKLLKIKSADKFYMLKDKYTAGDGIKIEDNVISATGSTSEIDLSDYQQKLIAGEGIKIEDNIISVSPSKTPIIIKDSLGTIYNKPEAALSTLISSGETNFGEVNGNYENIVHFIDDNNNILKIYVVKCTVDLSDATKDKPKRYQYNVTLIDPNTGKSYNKSNSLASLVESTIPLVSNLLPSFLYTDSDSTLTVKEFCNKCGCHWTSADMWACLLYSNFNGINTYIFKHYYQYDEEKGDMLCWEVFNIATSEKYLYRVQYDSYSSGITMRTLISDKYKVKDTTSLFYATREELEEVKEIKQNKLTAGKGLELTEATSEISADPLLKVINSQNMTNIPSDYIAGNTLLEYGYYPAAKTIAENAFKDCTNLKELVLTNNLETIGLGALSGCSSLKKLTIPFVGDGGSKTYFGHIFGATSSGAHSTSYTNSFIPTQIEELTITGDLNIGSFYGVNKINNIKITGKPKILENFGYTNLSSIEIPNSITAIYNSAFSNSYIKNVYYKGTIEDWCGINFGNAYSCPIHNIYTEGYSTLWALNSEGNYYEIKDNISLSEGLKTISENCFYWYSDKITGIELPKSLVKINRIGTNIPNIYYKGTIEDWCKISMPDYAPFGGTKSFYLFDENNNYAQVTELSIPETVTKIYSGTLSGIGGVTKLIIPATLETYDHYAFAYAGYETIVFEGTLAANYVSHITDSYLFCGCENLKTLILKSPDGINKFGNKYFDYCSNLTDIYIASTKRAVEDTPFWSEAPVGVKVHVRPELVDSYTSSWKSLIDKGTVVIVGDYVDEETTE